MANPDRSMRRAARTLGAAALVGMGMLTSCGSKDKPADISQPVPSPSASAPAPAPTPTPTEKVITPGPNAGSGPGSYDPTKRVRPTPTALPGQIITGG